MQRFDSLHPNFMMPHTHIHSTIPIHTIPQQKAHAHSLDPVVQSALTSPRHLPGSDGGEFKTWLTTDTVEEVSMSLDSEASNKSGTVLCRA